MNQTHENHTDQLNQHLNQLLYHYESKYSTPLAIPGFKKIKPVEQKLLGLLEGREAISIKGVVAMLGMPNSTITSAVTRLIDKGFMVKETDPQDRRSYLLKLTKKGRELTAYGQHLKQQFAQALLEELTKEEQAQLTALFGKALQSLDQLDDAAVRSDYMNALQLEYNEFGPWLIEIKEVEKVPQQYMSKRDEILAADISFKVPVRKDRHRLRPGMLMYNRVVSLFEDRILILEASADGLTSHEVPLGAIRYLTASRNLLDSHIIFGTDEQVYDIDYNSVSTEVTDKLMKILREKILVKARIVDSSVAMDKSEIPVENYNRLVGGFPVKEGMTLLGYQPGIELEKNYTSTADAILNFHKKYELEEMMILADDKELLVIDSVNEVKREEDPDYSYRHVSICIADVQSIEMAEETSMNKLKSLLIRSGESVVAFKVAEDFDSTVLQRYLKL